jgi:hypothetical protein
LAAIEQRVSDGSENLAGLLPAVQAEIAVAEAECDADATSNGEPGDPLFRLRIGRWVMTRDELANLICVRDPSLRVLAFEFGVRELMAVRTVEDLAVPPPRGRSHIVAFGRSARADGGRRDPLVVDAATARILELSDGTRVASQISADLNHEGHLHGDAVGLKWIENLFAEGLLLLWDKRLDAGRNIRSAIVGLAFAAK